MKKPDCSLGLWLGDVCTTMQRLGDSQPARVITDHTGAVLRDVENEYERGMDSTLYAKLLTEGVSPCVRPSQI